MLVYDVTNRSSFEALNGWLKEMRTHLDSSSDMDSVVFIVCANKVLKKKMRGVWVLDYPSHCRILAHIDSS